MAHQTPDVPEVKADGGDDGGDDDDDGDMDLDNLEKLKGRELYITVGGASSLDLICVVSPRPQFLVVLLLLLLLPLVATTATAPLLCRSKCWRLGDSLSAPTTPTTCSSSSSWRR